MGVLVWDNVGDRKFESGLDRGVLYLPDGSAVPWNGLTKVVEQFDKKSSPAYFDGMKISDLTVLGDFAASLSAITYPDEFEELEGVREIQVGVYLTDQMPKSFGLCYRTRIGNDVGGDEVGYKIHILYNVSATPKAKSHSSISDDPEITEFEWDITAVPEEVPGFRPTAHYIINTTEIDPILLSQIESMLYGDSEADASLIPLDELFEMVRDWIRIEITDNGDGTWSATSILEGFIETIGVGVYQINDADAIFIDPHTYEISDTYGPVD